MTFDLAGECLGVEVKFVREILDRKEVNRIPDAAHDIEGVVDIRGESVPIVDMGRRIGLPRQSDCEDTRIIVFEIASATNSPDWSLRRSGPRRVLIPPGNIEPSPGVDGSVWRSDLLIGIARQSDLLILLLDVQRVFGSTHENHSDQVLSLV